MPYNYANEVMMRRFGRLRKSREREGIRIWAFLTLAVLIVSASAQDSPAQVPTIRSQVREVLVPVVVTNTRGQYITGLKASDFQVLEDGKSERIVSFRTERDLLPIPIDSATSGGTDTAGGPQRADAGPSDPRRTYLVVVDTLHTSSASFN